jgi:hypothetical protein
MVVSYIVPSCMRPLPVARCGKSDQADARGHQYGQARVPDLAVRRVLYHLPCLAPVEFLNQSHYVGIDGITGLVRC